MKISNKTRKYAANLHQQAKIYREDPAHFKGFSISKGKIVPTDNFLFQVGSILSIYSTSQFKSLRGSETHP